MTTDVLRLLRPVGTEPSGRETELAVLLREHDEARTAQGARFVFVRGPAGVGKSHLVEAFARSASAKGVAVFEGRSGRDARRTWGVVGPMVSQLLTHAVRMGVPEVKVAVLARALEPVKGLGAPIAGAERLALFDAVAELFTLAGRDAPIFVFPDLDVADRASLELVRYLAAVFSTPDGRGRGLFVLSFRDGGGLPEPLEELVGRVSGRTLSLTGLDVDGLRAFLSRSDVVQRLLDVTGGHPDRLTELLERPVAAVDFFVRRVERLGEPQRAVLDVLAVSPEALPVELIAGVLGAEVAPTAAQVDALVRERLVAVRLVDGRATSRFARDSEKDAVRALLPEARQRELSRQVGHALAAAGFALSAAELLLWAAPSEAAKDALEAAQALVRRGALEDALPLLERALPYTSAGQRAECAAALGHAQGLLGDYASGARRLLEAARLGEEVDRPARVLEAARLLIKRGRTAFARALLEVTAAQPSTALQTTACQAELAMLAGDPKGAVEKCRRALAREDATGEVAIVLRNVMGRALLAQGEAVEAQALFAQNALAADEAGLKQLVAHARLNEGVAAFKQGERAQAISAWEATGVESRPVQAAAHANLGSLYAESGDFELALEHLSRALQAFGRYSAGREVAMAASNLARLHHFLGDLDRAGELSEHALAQATRLGERYLVAGAKLNLGAVALDRRQLVEAARLLDEARVAYEQTGNDAYAALAAGLKARAHLQAGERTQAEVELGRRCVEKGAAGLPAAQLEVELTRGDLCLVLGDLLGAGRAAGRAREALLSRPDLEGPVRTHFLMGRLRQAAADASGAQAEFERAGRALDELVQRVPPVRRTAFLSVPRRAEVLAVVEPELKLPRAVASTTPAPEVDRFQGFVGRSAALHRVTRQLDAIGRSSATVLVRGESGTGKELLADALHALSSRRHMPLVKVNCAAMVEELLLSELFGHEKGAFTGAIRERKGRFELADGGTIFLDEIGDISPKAQVALLRVLQEREFERVGGTRTLKVDVRVICATNRDLEGLIAQGRFRADLYYRLKGVMLELPPLRDRLDDLPVLAQHFLDRASTERGEPRRTLSDDAMVLLSRHDWPGNIRELENVVAAASIFAEGPVVGVEAFSHVAELRALQDAPAAAPASLPRAAASPAPAPPAPAPQPEAPPGPLDYYELARQRGISLKELRHEVEMQCIKRALLEAKGNISEAARLLQMKRSRLSQIVNAEAELKEVAHGE
ncbi:MAG: sigma 54-interacting transcriptional regulator [Myxococcales bacterium]|nr:sigma 54-interacting transcriptional regulator [Myxococcales bacterium]